MNTGPNGMSFLLEHSNEDRARSVDSTRMIPRGGSDSDSQNISYTVVYVFDSPDMPERLEG